MDAGGAGCYTKTTTHRLKGSDVEHKQPSHSPHISASVSICRRFVRSSDVSSRTNKQKQSAPMKPIGNGERSSTPVAESSGGS